MRVDGAALSLTALSKGENRAAVWERAEERQRRLGAAKYSCIRWRQIS